MAIGKVIPTARLDVEGDVSATAFNTTSDREAKEHFRPIDPQEVLSRVLALPIARWTFKTQPGEQHMGPVAQDFWAAFGLGKDETVAKLEIRWPSGVVQTLENVATNQALEIKEPEK